MQFNKTKTSDGKTTGANIFSHNYTKPVHIFKLKPYSLFWTREYSFIFSIFYRPM